MQRTAVAPAAHLAALDPEVRGDMVALDALIADAMPGHSRAVWQGRFWGGTSQTIIGYGDLVQPRRRGPDVEWFIVGLARQKRHISVYVNAVADGRYLGAVYGERLGRVRLGAASIGVSTLDDLDQDVFREMIRQAAALSA